MISLLLAVIYAAFISLGLPDALLGSAWPVMHAQMNVPLSWAGIVTFVIAMGTVVSALLSDRLTLKLGPGKVTAISVALTAAALFGFSCSTQFWMLCLIAIPYGLGAGSIDAALNNYVALHYSSRHMSWLHCMWGVGTSVGPVIMGWVLTGGHDWPLGYRIIALMQVALTAVIVLSLPLWKQRPGASGKDGKAAPAQAIPLRKLVMMPGAKEALAALRAMGIERTVMLTGDREAPARAVAQRLGVDETHAQLLPQDKLRILERICAQGFALSCPAMSGALPPDGS